MLKPIDIHNAEFKRSFKGYNEEEVDAFLAKVVSEYENLFQENQRLHDEVATLTSKLSHMGNREDDVYHLISLTKETVAEARDVAKQHAADIVAEAESRAKSILAEAEAQEKKYIYRLQRMAEQESEFKERIRELMESIWRQVEAASLTESSESLTDGTNRFADETTEPMTARWHNDSTTHTKVFHPDDGMEDTEAESGMSQTKVFRKVGNSRSVDGTV